MVIQADKFLALTAMLAGFTPTLACTIGAAPATSYAGLGDARVAEAAVGELGSTCASVVHGCAVGEPVDAAGA